MSEKFYLKRRVSSWKQLKTSCFWLQMLNIWNLFERSFKCLSFPLILWTLPIVNTTDFSFMTSRNTGTVQTNKTRHCTNSDQTPEINHLYCWQSNWFCGTSSSPPPTMPCVSLIALVARKKQNPLTALCSNDDPWDQATKVSSVSRRVRWTFPQPRPKEKQSTWDLRGKIYRNPIKWASEILWWTFPGKGYDRKTQRECLCFERFARPH